MPILVTGGLGYIGSHSVVELLNANREVIILDNLSNCRIEVLDKIRAITGKLPKFYEVDLRDSQEIDNIFKTNDIEAVIHFAGLKSVGESVENPLDYYCNNVSGTLNLCETMKKYNCKKLVFSSSATVYGMNNISPVDEKMPLSTTNPYGNTKLVVENILRDLYHSDTEWRIMLLRYFNPIGAHKSGLIGENPVGIPNNLLPYIMKVACKKLDCLSVYGNDYDTPDGTGIRDYIHVMDLAKGHLSALGYIKENKGIEAVNLGTGKGYSVLEMIKTFEKVSGVKVDYRIAPRREGDIAICYANASKANMLLNWKAEKSLEEMCDDSWRFAKSFY